MLMPFVTDFSQEIKMIGAVAFIRVLLLIAGVEPNPGPLNQTFVFRYQYLLIEVGTEVMQKLFDDVIGTDIGTYLATNITAANKLQWLIDTGKITKAQQKYLPPIDTKPMSANFDITLLSCLLRNVCGLRPFNDVVWMKPASTDHSQEADVTRLRECRNNVAHMRTVYISDTDLAVKWTELTEILKRLNSCHSNGVTDLTSKIYQTGCMDIDDNLRKRYDTVVEQWKEMEQLYDQGLGELQQGQTEIKQDLTEIKQGQTEIKQSQSETNRGQTEIKQGQTEIKQSQSETNQGLTEIKQSQLETNQGLTEIKQSQSETKQGQTEIKRSQSETNQGLTELKHGQTEIKQSQSETNQGLTEIKQSQSEMKQGQTEIKQGLLVLQSQLQKDAQKDPENREKKMQEMRDTQQAAKLEKEIDLKNRLLKMYQEGCRTLPVLPLCDDDEVGVDLLSIYQPPSLFHVPYHRTEEKDRTEEKEQYPISSYKEIFSKGDHCFSNVFITGDAGVGKSSFCKCMSLLWYKSQCNENVEDEVTQKNIEFMGKFDFTFFVSLRDTDRTDVITMIIEQVYTEAECVGKMNELSELVQNTLKEHVCLVILDGLDEWSPKTSRKKKCALPDKITADKCCCLITCRPYKIETVRLSPKDLDRQVQIRGISGESTTRYVEEIVARCNKGNGETRTPNDFVEEVKKCGLYHQLCIPIVGSHLVAIWFDCKLTDMSRALIYSNILEMLFERAGKRGIHSPSAPLCSVQLPDSLTDLVYFKTHFALLAKICFLSFRSLFKLDNCVSVLVYTRKQLMLEPYFFSDEEMDFLCNIGILSRNKIIGRFGKQEQKLSFLHNSYLEYFAALFVSSFDSSNAFDNIVKEWTTINDIVQFQNFFIFLSGFSCEKVKFILEDIYLRISDDLTCCRRNAMFHNDSTQIKSLQSMVVNCFKQVSRSSNPNFSLKLEDFIFKSKYDSIDSVSGDDVSYTDVSSFFGSLKQLILLNRTCIHYLHSPSGEYFVEFDDIKNLQCLHVGAELSGGVVYDVKFTECMLQNQSTLHTVCIVGIGTLIPELPVRSLQHLTSLSLSYVKMPRNSLHNLVTFLSYNVLIENIELSFVYDSDCDDSDCDDSDCDDSDCDDSDCTWTLNLPHHTKLTSLCLYRVNILCNHVNNSSLKSITLYPLSESIGRCYIDLFNCIKYSQLEHLYIYGSTWYRLDKNTMKALADTVNTLPYIKSLTLWRMELPDDVLLQLHPDVTQVEIKLESVTLSRQCFHCFIESCVNNKSVIKVKLDECSITSVDGETHSVLSWDEAVVYMSEYLTSIPTVNITGKGDRWLDFDTGSCR